jgi:NAD(P)-dependent dehydrogenase (short-subunit alcohol dehydrogenase family)
VSDSKRVVVVTGAGGIGEAVARRIGFGSAVVLADFNAERLKCAASRLQGEGYDVTEQPTDVSKLESVESLAKTASEIGTVEILVHTAGLSPIQATAEAIWHVDLLGTALVLDAFGARIATGGAGVFIASMAGTMSRLDLEFERRLATAPTASLLNFPEISAITEPGTAYGVSKRANQLRIQAASIAWGRRGARVNSVSPGTIATSMGREELEGPSGDHMRMMIAASAAGRIGTAQDIAAAVEFLVGPNSTFITGTDLLVDGGTVSALLNGG